MSPGRTIEISFDDPARKRLDPMAFSTRFPKSDTGKKLTKAIEVLAGDNFCAIGYGSQFNGSAKADSETDVLIIPYDTERFHRENLQGRWMSYGSPQLADWHNWLNKSGPNYYQGKLRLTAQEIPIKIGVIGFDCFLKHAQGALPGNGEGHGYVAGRVAKPVWLLAEDYDQSRQQKVNIGLNQARIDTFWLALSLADNPFSRQDLTQRYTEISYRADTSLRPDARNPRLRNIKVADLTRAYGQDLNDLIGDLAAEFARSGIIEPIGPDSFDKVYTLPRDCVDAWLRKCSRAAFGQTLKNWATTGFVEGIIYYFAKRRRVVA